MQFESPTLVVTASIWRKIIHSPRVFLYICQLHDRAKSHYLAKLRYFLPSEIDHRQIIANVLYDN